MVKLSARRSALMVVAMLCAGFATVARFAPAAASGTADLSVTLSGPASVNEGEDSIYSATVSNAGPDGATGVALTDQVPASFTFDPGRSTTGCFQSGAVVTCSLLNIPVGFRLVPQIAFKTSTTGTFTNTVSVSGNESDPTPADNTASAQSTVAPPAAADMAVSWSGPSSLYQGQAFFEQLSVFNQGPDSSGGGTVTLAIPPGVTPGFSGCSSAGSGYTCMLDVGSRPPGTGEVFRLQMTATELGQFVLSADVTSSVQDPNPSNNSASTTVNVSASADLDLTSTATPNPVVAGHKVTVTVQVTNNGPSPAPGVSWNTSWSSDAKVGIDLDNYSISSGTCTVSGSSLVCMPGDLADGQQVVLTVVLQPRSKGTLGVGSSAASTVYDPTSSNNAAETTVTIS